VASRNGPSPLIQAASVTEAVSFGSFRIANQRRLERDGSPIPLGSRAPHVVPITAASALNLLVPVEDPTPRLIELLRDRQPARNSMRAIRRS
jgi:hypothetical protein